MKEFEELFYRDTYAKEFDAKVISSNKGEKGWEVILDDTAFYPEGGGQEADHGTLKMMSGNDVNVTDVRRNKTGEIVHYCDGGLKEGDTVHGSIDWDRRFDHMQNHSGEHIVSGIIHEHYGYGNVGFHMGDMIMIDVSGPLSWKQLAEVEKEANETIYADLPILVSYPDDKELAQITYRSKKELTGQVRIVNVPGRDICACCGTHVARTGEIGIIKFFSMINYKGGVRIWMASGLKALGIISRRTNQDIELSHMLASDPDNIVDALTKVKDESAAKDRRITELVNSRFELEAGLLPDKAPLVIRFEEGLSTVETRRFCECLLENDKGICVAVLSRQNKSWYYVIGSRTVDVRPAGKALNAKLQGRGGGSAEMIQGTFAAGQSEIENVLKEELNV